MQSVISSYAPKVGYMSSVLGTQDVKETADRNIWEGFHSTDFKVVEAKESEAPSTDMEETMSLVGVVHLPEDFKSMTDAELMAAIGKGENLALETIYDRHVRGCYGLALKIVREPAVAEEVVQDVFMKLWTHPERFNAERGKFSGWLLTLVHNRSVDKIRRAKSGVNNGGLPLHQETAGGVTLADVIADTAPGPHESAWSSQKGSIVREALQSLPAHQREAITLAYFGGLTQKEIADRLNEPLGTIKTRTRTALHQLRNLFESQGLVADLR